MTDPEQTAAVRPARQAWLIVGVLFVASIMSVLDRQVLNLVVDPVRRDLGISEVQVGLLQGLSFAVFYSLMGLPLGLCVDRYNRRTVLMAGVAIWSVATLAGGLAPSFGWLFLARLLVGVGEATLSPAAISLIGDLFPADRRGRPISIFLMGQAIGSAASIAFIGLILSLLSLLPLGVLAFWPALNRQSPWRIAFIVSGLLGLVLLPLLSLWKEPARRATPGVKHASLASGLAFFTRNGSVFLPHYIGFSSISLAHYALLAWSPTMMIRKFAMPAAEVGRLLGAALAVGGIAGALLGGVIVDRLCRRFGRQTLLPMLGLATLCYIPGALAGLVPNAGLATVLITLSVGLFPLIGTIMVAATQTMVPGNLRGVSTSLTSLGATLLGLSLGPVLVALATARLFGDPKSVGLSLATVIGPSILIAAALQQIAYRALRRRLRSDPILREVFEAA